MASLNKNIKLIIFDFDGTLADSKDFHQQGLINSLKKEGLTIKKSFINKKLGMKTTDILKGMHITNGRKIRRIFQDIDDEKTKNIRKVKLIGKTKETIRSLSRNHKLIILSNAETEFVKEVCKREKIFRYFTEIIGEQKFSTKATEIKKLLKRGNYKKNQVIFIGDRYTDVENGEKAGIITVAVSNKYSWSSKKDLLNQSPDFLILKIEDVIRIIN